MECRGIPILNLFMKRLVSYDEFKHNEIKIYTIYTKKITEESDNESLITLPYLHCSSETPIMTIQFLQ